MTPQEPAPPPAPIVLTDEENAGGGAPGARPAAPAPNPATLGAAPGTQRMFRANDGAPVDVPIDQVSHAVRSGQVGFGNTQPVQVAGPDGRVRTVSGAEAAKLLTTAAGLGSRVATVGEHEEQIERDVSESPMGLAHAGGAGLLRGLTFGVSDAVLAQDEAQRRSLDRSKKYNPGTSNAGEAAGLLLSALPTGGESLAAKGVAGVTALPRGVASLGRGAERLAVRGAEALGVEGTGVAARALGHTAQAATEGAFYGVGNAISDASIQDEPLTAEKLLAGAGHGAVLGAGAGLGLSLGGVVLVRAGRGVLEAGGDAVGGLLQKLGGGAEKVAAKEGEAAAQLEGRSALGRFLDGQETEKTIRAVTGTDLAATRKLRDLGEAVERRVVDQVHDQLPELVGKSSLAGMGREEIAEAASKNLRKWGDEIGTSLRELDSLGAKPSIAEIVDTVKSKVLDPLGDGTGIYAREHAAVAGRLEEIAQTKGIDTFEGLQRARVRLDKDIKFAKANTDPVHDALVDLRNVIEKQIEDQGQRAAVEAGSDFAAKYTAAKEQYQAARWVRDASEKSAAREATNRTIGMSELVGGNAGASAGASIGGALAGPVGGFLGSGVGALGGAVLNNYVRRYGAQVAATMARQAVRTDLVKAASLGFDHAVENTVGRFLGVKAKLADLAPRVPGAGVIAPKLGRQEHASSKDEFEHRRDTIAAYLANPGPANAEATQGLPQGLAQHVSDLALAKANFLASKIPQAASSSPLQPHLKPGAVSPAEQARFLRYARAVDDPLSVLEDMKDGKLSREGAEALRATSPLLFKQIQTQVMQTIQALDKPLPHDKALAINTLLDVPAAASLTPQHIASLQSGFPPAPPVEHGGFGPSPQSPNASNTAGTKVAASYASRSDSLSR